MAGTPVFNTHPISYAVKDAAACIGVSPALLERVIARGDLNVQWLDGKRVIRTNELMAYVDSLPYAKEGAQS